VGGEEARVVKAVQRAPDEVFVTWCGKCGSVEVADRERRKPSSCSCSRCPVGKSRMRVTRYVLAPPRVRTVKRARRKP
jgi:hypothetical protein